MTTTLSIRMDEDLKADAEEFFSDIGMNLTTWARYPSSSDTRKRRTKSPLRQSKRQSALRTIPTRRLAMTPQN